MTRKGPIKDWRPSTSVWSRKPRNFWKHLSESLDVSVSHLIFLLIQGGVKIERERISRLRSLIGGSQQWTWTTSWPSVLKRNGAWSRPEHFIRSVAYRSWNAIHIWAFFGSLTTQANHWIRNSVDLKQSYPIVSSEDIREAGLQILGDETAMTALGRTCWRPFDPII